MRLLTDILEYAKEEDLSKEEFDRYREALKGKMPQEIAVMMEYISKYSILSREDFLDLIRDSSSKSRQTAEKYDISDSDYKDIMKIVKHARNNIKIVPLMQDSDTIQDVIDGTKTTDDLVLDFSTDRGRDEIVRQFTPLMNKIVNQYSGKSSLSRAELMSAAMMGLAGAMGDYRRTDRDVDADNSVSDKGEEKKQKHLSFQQYAGWRIAQQILNDMNNYTRTVRLPQRQYDKIRKSDDYDTKKMFNTVSIDSTFNDEGDTTLDRMPEMSIDPASVHDAEAKPAMRRAMEKIYKIIDDKFSKKNSSVFYKTFGLNGFEEQRPVDIAKELKTTRQNITNINRRVIAFLKDTPEAKPLLQFMLDNLSEQLMVDSYRDGQKAVCEAFLSNDLYILLEEVTRFYDKSVFESTLKNVLAEYDDDSVRDIIESLEGGSEKICEKFYKCRKLYVHFLENMWPTETFNKKSDYYILNEVESLSRTYVENDIKL